MTESAGVRGAMVNTIAERVRAARSDTMRAMSAALVVDEAVHRDDVVEGAERRIEHVADAELAEPDPAITGARSRARLTSVGEISTATTSAPRLASSTASAPVPQPASSMRAPRRSSGSQPRRVARIASRPARTVARMRPTGSSEVRRVQASTAVRSK